MFFPQPKLCTDMCANLFKPAGIRSVAALGVAILTASLLLACSREDRVARVSQRLVREFPAGATARSPQSVPRYIPASVYIDGSASMAGFPGCEKGQSHFDRVLMGVDLALNSDELRSSVMLFGGDTTGRSYFLATAVGNHLQCPDPYRFAQNPDSALYARILSDTVSLVSVYVTDGVQSDGKAITPAASLQVLRRWLARGHSLAILAYHSQFQGRIWSEAADTMYRAQSVASRPFYLFILAYSETVLDHTIVKLRARAAPYAEIRFSPSAIQCNFTPAVSYRISLPKYRWLFVHSAMPLKDRDGGGIRLGEFLCEVSPDYPMSRIGYEWNVQSRRWIRRGFSDPIAAKSGTFSLTVEEDTGGLLRAGIFSHLSSRRRGRYGLHTLSLTPVHGTTMRSNIMALSTDDDSDPRNFNRTYLFADFVAKLVEIDFERRKIPLQYHFTIEETRQ